MTEDQIKSVLYSWVNEIVGPETAHNFQVIFYRQGKPRPERFFSIDLMQETDHGLKDDYLDTDEEGIYNRRGYRTRIVSFESYGSGSLEAMKRLKLSAYFERIQDLLYDQNGISILNTEDILNLTGLLDSTYEERAKLDIEIHYFIEDSEDLGIIESVDVQGDINDIEGIIDLEI
jgi:hypothetical protein